MDKYWFAGIMQMGVGTEDFYATERWLYDMFQADVQILEDDTIAERMLPYTGNSPQRRHACINCNLQGGGGFEIWQYKERKPIPADFDIQVGDLGFFTAKVKSHNIAAFHEELTAKYSEITPVVMDPRGIPTFYIHDPAGNCFQVVEDNYIFIDRNRFSGGVVGAMVGVTDIERSRKVYSDILGYDAVVYDKTGVFSDWQGLRGGGQTYRRVLLTRSRPFQGPFSELYGNSTIELVQALDRTPRKIYEGRYWGDPGFIQLCFDVINMRELEAKCNELGFKFTVDSCPGNAKFDMGKAGGHFTYIEDPDGSLIEFVETHFIPLNSALNIKLDFLKRDRTKAFPKFFFQLLKLNRVKPR